MAPYCSITRCAGSCLVIDSTEVALTENGAFQSKASSVSIETISLGLPSFDKSGRAGAILPSLVKAGSQTLGVTAPLANHNADCPPSGGPLGGLESPRS